VRLNTLTYEVETGLRVSVSSASYADIEALRAALGSSGLQMEEGGSVQEGAGLTTELLLRPIA